MKYVLGFAFDDLGRVALIRKSKPEWQNGLLNGVGGKVEKNETCKGAMVREFQEETGLLIPAARWACRGELVGELCEKVKEDGEQWSVHVYTVVSSAVRLVQSLTDERVDLYMVHDIQQMRGQCIENVPALVELCQLPVAQPSNSFPYFVLRY